MYGNDYYIRKKSWKIRYRIESVLTKYLNYFHHNLSKLNPDLLTMGESADSIIGEKKSIGCKI